MLFENCCLYSPLVCLSGNIYNSTNLYPHPDTTIVSDMKVIVNLLFMLFLLITHSTSSPTSKHRSNAPFSAPKYPEWVQPILDALEDSVKMAKVSSSLALR